ncbi:hypothetical protein [Streptomyces sp. x-45]|uniref:hypothetical protein n=1 Tax=Streptomyces sp. x-45 TaxID=2789281 RepID=UPI00398122D0
MTPRIEHRRDMSVEEFEELDRRAPELVRLEFIRGRVAVKPMPDGNHRRRTDGRGSHLVGRGCSAAGPCGQARRVYGCRHPGLPLIDRESCSVVVFNQPENGSYQHEERLPIGATVHLPAPVDITLDTEPLKELAD